MESQPPILILLEEHWKLARASAEVLRESHQRAQPLLAPPKALLSAGERETLEALTARFSRLSDFLVQRLFRTLDEVEMGLPGTPLDTLNGMEKRGIISSVADFRKIRATRNAIAHEYLIEGSDAVVHEAYQQTEALLDSVERFTAYARSKGYLPPENPGNPAPAG
jgi:hypothetical protein